jgi:hypothetical protein
MLLIRDAKAYSPVVQRLSSSYFATHDYHLEQNSQLETFTGAKARVIVSCFSLFEHDCKWLLAI